LTFAGGFVFLVGGACGFGGAAGSVPGAPDDGLPGVGKGPDGGTDAHAAISADTIAMRARRADSCQVEVIGVVCGSE
jgi:hypothetical protein